MGRPALRLLVGFLLVSISPIVVIASPGVTAWLKLQHRVERDARVGGALSLPTLGAKTDDDLRALGTAFVSETPFVRRQIVRALGEFAQAPESSLPVLLSALDDNDDHVRAHAVFALAHFGRPAEIALVAELRRSAQHPARTTCVAAALRLMPDLDVAALVELYRSAIHANASAQPRVSDAVAASDEVGSPHLACVLPGILAAQSETGLRTVVGFLDDPDAAVRHIAVAALAERDRPADDSVATALLAAWEKSAPEDSSALRRALLATGPAGDRALLRCLRKHPSAEMRARAADALESSETVAPADLLAGLSEATDAEVKTVRLQAALRRFSAVRDFASLAPSLRSAIEDLDTRSLLWEESRTALRNLPATERPAFIAFLIDSLAQLSSEESKNAIELLSAAGPAARPAIGWLCSFLAPPTPPGLRQQALEALERAGGWDEETRQRVLRLASDSQDPLRNHAARALAANGPAPRAIAERIVAEWSGQSRSDFESDSALLAALLGELGADRLRALATREDGDLTLRAAALRALPPSPETAALALRLLGSGPTPLAVAACEWLLESPDLQHRALAVRRAFQPRTSGNPPIDIDERSFVERAARLAPGPLLEQTVDTMIAEQDYGGLLQRQVFREAWPRVPPAEHRRLAERLFAQLPQSGSDQRALARTLLALTPQPDIDASRPIRDAMKQRNNGSFADLDADEIRPLLELLEKYGHADRPTLRQLRRWCAAEEKTLRIDAFRALRAVLAGHTASESVLWRALRDDDPMIAVAAAYALELDVEHFGNGFQSWSECLITLYAADTLDAQVGRGWRAPSYVSVLERKHGDDVVKLESVVVTGSNLPMAGPSPPPFPWPPPQAVHHGQFGIDFPAELLGPAEQNLGQLHRRFVQALRQVDERFEVGLFGAPGGFVLFTKLERIDREGRPLPGARRWTEGKVAPYSLSDLVTRIFFEPSGYFRELAFVVTNEINFGASNRPLPDIAAGGDMPDELAQLPLGGRHVYLFVYAFERKPGGEVVPLRSLSAPVHLRECGLLAALH